jgi:hypothetical protein
MDDLKSKKEKLNTFEAIVNSMENVKVNDKKDTMPELNSSDVNLITVMKELEAEGEMKAKELLENTPSGGIGKLKFGNSLKKIMNDLDSKFEKKMGRPMTYSEMRDIYG